MKIMKNDLLFINLVKEALHSDIIVEMPILSKNNYNVGPVSFMRS